MNDKLVLREPISAEKPAPRTTPAHADGVEAARAGLQAAELGGESRCQAAHGQSYPTIRIQSDPVVMETERPTIRNSDAVHVEISSDDYEQFAGLHRSVPLDPNADFENFFEEARLRFHEFPRWIRRILLRFSTRGSSHGAMVIHGFPLDEVVPPTPTSPDHHLEKPYHASEFWLSCVAGALGEPVAYLPEKEGRIFQDVYPTRVNEANLSSESSSILLDFHTEIAFHPLMPDYLLLYCLRQDRDGVARTLVSCIRRFLPRLTPGVQDVLFTNQFRAGVDYSFGNLKQKSGAGPLVAVLYGDRLDPFLRYDLDLMVGESPSAQHALQAVRLAVNAYREEIILAPGSLMIIDNRRTVHARSQFKAYYDGTDRWLQRLAVVRDLEASLRDRVRGSRVIATDFSAFL